MVIDHREDTLGAEEFADEPASFFGVVFCEVRVAAEFRKYVAEGNVSDGIGDEVHVLAVAAKHAVHELEGTLVDADARDGNAFFRAFGNGAFDDVLVLEHDAAFHALEAGEAAVRIQRVPEDAAEHVASGHFLQGAGAVLTCNIHASIFQMFFHPPVGTLGVERLVDRECDGEK